METSVLDAKNRLSELMRRAEAGEDIVIRRGRNGVAFRLVPVAEKVNRTLKPDPSWAGKIQFEDQDIWDSEWEAED